MASGATEFGEVGGLDFGGSKSGGGGSSRFGASARRQAYISAFEDGKPSLAADIDPADFSTQTLIRAFSAASKSWLLSGTNAASALAVLDTRGGVTLTTAGANNDQMIISPLVINSVQMSPFGKVSWSSEYLPIFRATIRLSASSIAAQRIVIGLKLTASAEDHDTGAAITDDDYMLFVFDTTHASSATLWHYAQGVSGTDYNNACETKTRNATAHASDTLTLEISVDQDRVPHFFIDNEEVGVGVEMNTVLVLKPVAGIQALTGAAKDFTIRSIECFQNG